MLTPAQIDAVFSHPAIASLTLVGEPAAWEGDKGHDGDRGGGLAIERPVRLAVMAVTGGSGWAVLVTALHQLSN